MFLIVSPEDIVVYQIIYTNLIKKEITFLHELITFASLDIIETSESNSNAMFLKSVDKFNEYTVSAFSSAGKMKLILLHESKISDDSMKAFFYEVYEYYCKALLNPFIDKNTKIFSSNFDNKIKIALKKHIG